MEDPIATSGVAWLGEARGVTSRDLLAGAITDDERSARQEAVEWLADLLDKEPVPANEVRAKAEKAGISWATVRRAKAGVRSKRWGRPGGEGGWCWMLGTMLAPLESEDAHHRANMLRSETSKERGASDFGVGLHLPRLVRLDELAADTVFGDPGGADGSTDREVAGHGHPVSRH